MDGGIAAKGKPASNLTDLPTPSAQHFLGNPRKWP